MSFHVGQKVVCVFKGYERPMTDGCPVPKYNEIYTVSVCPVDGYPLYMQLSELPSDVAVLIEFFRPIDYSFGEKVCEEMTKIVQQEPITVTP